MLDGDPRRVRTLADLSRALELLRARAARGSHKTKISIAELARRVAEPRSTVHSYVTGRLLAPADVLDRMVTALGATSAELREWGEAWFRVAANQEFRKRNGHVPRELPAEVSEFTGRAGELAELDRLLTDPARKVVLSGVAGVGKTALAVRWGHTVTSAFPDGCLYVDLCGVGPDEVLARFLRTLGAEVPEGQAEREARYRSTLAGRRMLIVLDNARDAEQVRPLLPGTGVCFVVVTSRDRLSELVARSGARRIGLDPLPPPDAAALLRKLVGPRVDADPVAAGRLARYCCYLPLALRVVAEWVVSRPAVPLTALAEELPADP